MMADKNMNQYNELATFLNSVRFWVTDMSGTPVLKWISGESLLRGYSDFRLMKEQSSTPATPASGYTTIFAGDDGKVYSLDSSGNVAAIGEGVLPHIVCMRLSPTTGDPVELDELSSVKSIRWTPFKGNGVRLYDGSAWKFLVGTEKTFKLTDEDQTCTTSNGSAVITALTDTSMLVVGMKVSGVGIAAGATISSIDSATQVTISANATADGSDIAVTFKAPANTRYDLFGKIISGDADLRRPVAWTNLTTRATALTLQDGVKVLTGETTALFVGYVTTGDTDGELDFSIASESIYNHYHIKPLSYGVWKEFWLPASALRPSDSGGCGALEELDGSSVRAFDPSTDEQGVINLCLPKGWSGKIKVKTRWMVDDANAGNVVWAVKTENAAQGEVMGNAATTTLTANAAGGTQHEFSETVVSAEHTAGAEGENIILHIIRDADNALDTYASDSYLYGAMVYYLMNEDGIG